MEDALRQLALDTQPATKGSLIFSKNEWQVLGRDLKLSPRALQLVRGIFDAQTAEAIADDMSISVHTVHSYRARIYQRFGVCSQKELLVYIFGRYLEQHGLPKPQRSGRKRKRATKRRVRL